MNPPSTGRVTPVMNAASSDSRNLAAPWRSEGVPNLRIGVLAITLCPRAVRVLPSFSRRRKRFLFVMKNPGASAFTRMPIGARCVARKLVKFITPAFAAP